MNETYNITRSVYLRGLALCYLAAFLSLWIEFPGLYGRDGLIPVHSVIGDSDFQHTYWNVVPAFKTFKLRPDIFCEGLCLLGSVLSAVVACGGPVNSFMMFALWSFYLSMLTVGEIFLSFQWDILLVEVGFASIFIAPLVGVGKSDASPAPMWMVRFILFKLMLMSGVVKLQADCPTWKGLTALNYHYATTCIPNPLSWYAHQLPPLFQKVSVAVSFFVEGPGTYLILLPFRSTRYFSAIVQIQLQVMIILTGNYGFFNFLTCCLAIPLLDDWYWKEARGRLFGPFTALLKGIGVFPGMAILGYMGVSMYRWIHLKHLDIPDLPLWEQFDIGLKMNTKNLGRELDMVLPYLLLYVAATIAIVGLHHAWKEITGRAHSTNPKVAPLKQASRLARAAKALAVTAAIMFIFGANLTPMTSIHPNLRSHYPKYGLFRRMTGVGPSSRDKWGREVTQVERPEVIIYGSDDGVDWKEYDFHYKPGNITRRPPQIAPIQPRLDWQLWFAALGSYQQSPPWFLHLAHKLLNGSPSILKFVSHNPFEKNKNHAPKHIRADLFHYDFERPDKTQWWRPKDDAWWRRKRVKEYLPVISHGAGQLDEILKQFGWDRQMKYPPSPDSHEVRNSWFTYGVVELRRQYGEMTVAVAIALLPLLRLVYDLVRFTWPSGRRGASGVVGSKIKME